MANNKKFNRGFHKLLENVQTISTATTLEENNTSFHHISAKHKTRSHRNFRSTICSMKNYINSSISSSSNSNCLSNKDSCSASGTGSSTCSQSLSLFYLSCNSPHSIITFITTTIYCCMRNVHNNWCWWWPLQQRQLKQYKIITKTLSNSSAASTSTTTSTATSSANNRNFSTSFKWYFFLWLLLSILAPCISLTMTEVRIPKHIMRHETAALGCKYDLDGESLYSVKWYKDGFEFYRYVPRDMPAGQVFPLPGVYVDLQNSTDNVVVLHRVTLQSTGRYRCEVSGEAPSFQTVSGHEDMIVVVTPLKGPQITGGQPRYSIGEKVSVNCTSAPSKPICHLSWLINGVHANRSYLRYYEPKIVGREGLEVATLGLEFRVRG